MTQRPLIQIVIGSVREGRVSGPIAHWAADHARKRDDLDAELVDLKEWDLPMFDLRRPPAMGDYAHPRQIAFAETVARADGFLFVSPEYNHGYSSVLKNAIDFLCGEWRRKPASFVSFGNAGGARGVEQLRQVCVELEMAPLKRALHLFGVNARVGEGDFAAEADEAKRLSNCLDELAWWSRALLAARREDAS